MDIHTLRLVCDQEDDRFFWIGIEGRAGTKHGLRPDRLSGECPIEGKEKEQTEDSFQHFHLDS